MITPAQIAAYLSHSPLRFGLKWCCENTEHTCTPDTCNEQCLKDAANDLARFINEESKA